MAAPREGLTSREKGIMFGSLAVGAGILGVGLYMHLTKRKKKRKKKIRKKKDKKHAKGKNFRGTTTTPPLLQNVAGKIHGVFYSFLLFCP